MINTKEFETRKEAREYIEEIKSFYALSRREINYRITVNYPLILVGRKVKSDKTQQPKSYTVTWVC